MSANVNKSITGVADATNSDGSHSDGIKKTYWLKARELLNKGFEPLPMAPGRKYCVLPEWTTRDITEVVNDGKSFGHGICIRLGNHGLGALDIDVYSIDIVEELLAFIRLKIGAIVTRVGFAPKTLVFVLCHDISGKLESNGYVDSHGNVNKIEFLGKGQQCAAYGLHPNILKPYEWSGELPPRDQLPVISRAVMDMVFSLFDKLALAKGWTLIEKQEGIGTQRVTDPLQYHYNRIVDIDLVLSHYGWTESGEGLWTRPDKKNGASASVLNGVLHCFTSSTCLEADGNFRSYDIVMAYTYMDDHDAMVTHAESVLIKHAREVFRVPVTLPAGCCTEPVPMINTSGFELVMARDIVADVKPTEWLINDTLPADSLSELFGAPGTYKSFLSLAWGLSIASGTPWCGHSVKQAPVIMIIGEGHNGYAKRIAVWCKMHNVDINKIPLSVSKVPMQMLDDNSARAVAEAVEQFSKTYGKVGMVCIDTVARNFGPGDENSTVDMTKFVANLDAYIGLGINKLLVHHTGHSNTDRARGSSVLLGAVDSEYRLSKKGGIVTLTNTKMKDDPQFTAMTFKPKEVPLGGNFSNIESSIVLVSTDEKLPRIELSPQMRDALTLMDMIAQDNGFACKSSWMTLCVEEQVYTKAAFYNAIKTMEKKGVIVIADEYVRRY